MNQAMLKARIADVLEALDYREREILRLRYGLADGYSYTLEEVGKIFSVTRERVRQIENKAVRTLQHPTRAQKAGRLRRAAHRRPVDLRRRRCPGDGKRVAVAAIVLDGRTRSCCTASPASCSDRGAVCRCPRRYLSVLRRA